MRTLLLPVLTCLSLAAQDNPGGNRMGVGLSVLTPIDFGRDTFDTGFQVGLQIHYNRESRHLGRLRIDYLRADSKGLVQTGTNTVWNGTTWVVAPIYERNRIQAHGVAYEWMPHLNDHSRSGLFGILGVGGMVWDDSTRNHLFGDLGFTVSVGGGWRFNPHAAVEVRFVNVDLDFHDTRPSSGSTRSFLTFGTSLRF